MFKHVIRIFLKLKQIIYGKNKSSDTWVQRIQSQRYVDVKFPFLNEKLISWCRGLPRNHKCIGRETKVRLRNELKTQNLIPKENIDAGRIVGTKHPFSPILEKWFKNGLEKWSNDNLPPDGLDNKIKIKMMELSKEHLWSKWRAATINTFLTLLDEGKFNYKEPFDFSTII